ncbi:MAG: lysophospholipid acyltransferase family protein [Armatimonas sp.]
MSESPSTKASTTLWQRFLAATLPGLTRRIENMPRQKALARGAALGRMGWNLAKKQRRTTLRNLAIAFPELSPAEREDLARRCFIHWGKVTMDFLKAPSYDIETTKALVTNIEGFAEYGIPALESKKGVVAVTAHLGSFEIFGRYMGLSAIPLTVIVRAPSDPLFGGYVRRIRESGNYRTIDSYGGPTLRALLKALKNGEVVGILPDQNSNDLFVPFFGVPAGTADGASLLAYKTGAPLIPSFCALRPDDTYEIVIRPPIEVDPKADRAEELLRTTTLFTQEIEAAARRWPEQYLWLHNRFKASFDPQYKDRWPEGFDYEALKARWENVS